MPRPTLPILDTTALRSAVVGTRSTLGLDPPRYSDPIECALIRLCGGPAYISEGRATFEALVPDRYKYQQEEKD